MFEEYKDELFLPLKGKKVYYQKMEGNLGDELIDYVTLKFFKEYNIQLVSLKDCNVVVFAGGGNLGNLYPNNEKIRNELTVLDKEFVVFPQTFYKRTKLDRKCKVYARDVNSFNSLKLLGYSVELVPDVVLMYKSKIEYSPEYEEGLFFRDDEERKTNYKTNEPTKLCKEPLDYLRLVSKYKKIKTDRLHCAISAVLVGVPDITIVGNSYHKNKSMWETWLKDLGVKYED